MQSGSKEHRKSWWPGRKSQRLSLISLAIKRTRLRFKLQSLNRQYHSQPPRLQHDDQSNTFQHAQETYWYETACLIEEARKLKISHPTTIVPEPSLTDSGKNSQAFENTSLYKQILKTTLNQPPTVIPIIILSFLHGISICAGILWLLAPHLMDS